MTEEIIDGLAEAAHAGDLAATRELGRLLCLVPVNLPVDDGDGDGAPFCPGEPWLRRAFAANPNDAVVATLLATRLVQQIEYMLSTQVNVENGTEDWAAAARHRQAEAQVLLSRAIRADPANRAATATTAYLTTLLDSWRKWERGEAGSFHPAGDARVVAHTSGYSCYLVSGCWLWGSTGRVETLVVTDPAELRWACARWLDRAGPVDGNLDELVLLSSVSGERTARIDLTAYRSPATAHPAGRIDWAAVPVPALTGELLPVGHPVHVRGVYPRQSDNVFHYGFTHEHV